MSTPPVTVAAALICDEDGRILLARRPHGGPLAGKWEFPGGKVEPGESPEAALERECREELGCEVEVGRIYHVLPGPSGPGGRILLLFYRARLTGGAPRSMEGNDLAWAAPGQMGDYDLLDADRALPALFQRDFPHFVPGKQAR